MQIQLLSRESPLPGLQCSYRVAAWQRDLGTPPWKGEEKNKDSNSQRHSLPLRNCQLIHENAGGKTECQCCIHVQSQSSPAWTVNTHTHASTHRPHTEVPKNVHSIDWLLIENSWGGKKEVEQDLNTDSYLHKGRWNTATKSRGLKIQGVFFLWLLSIFILMTKPYDW